MLILWERNLEFFALLNMLQIGRSYIFSHSAMWLQYNILWDLLVKEICKLSPSSSSFICHKHYILYSHTSVTPSLQVSGCGHSSLSYLRCKYWPRRIGNTEKPAAHPTLEKLALESISHFPCYVVNHACSVFCQYASISLLLIIPNTDRQYYDMGKMRRGVHPSW